MSDRELEYRKLALRKQELDVRREELQLSQTANNRGPTRKYDNFKSPLGVAVIGGFLAALSAVFANSIKGFSDSRMQEKQHAATAKLEEERHESELILHALNTGGDLKKSRENLRFLLNAGLIRENAKIAGIVNDPTAVVPSFSTVEAQFKKLEPELLKYSKFNSNDYYRFVTQLTTRLQIILDTEYASISEITDASRDAVMSHVNEKVPNKMSKALWYDAYEQFYESAHANKKGDTLTVSEWKTALRAFMDSLELRSVRRRKWLDEARNNFVVPPPEKNNGEPKQDK